MALQLRHEWKHEISPLDLLALRQRLRAVAAPDPHGAEGKYLVRSLYFDTPEDKALREKLDGVARREKFRVRYYDGDLSTVHLEKKSKVNNLGWKESAPLSPEEVERLLAGDCGWMTGEGRPLAEELLQKMRGQRLAPRTIVDYTREAFLHPAGNVRVTLDYHIRTSLNCRDFLRADCLTLPAGESPILLEVKWDGFLPDIIRDAVQLENRRAAAFSKYAQCRIYG